MELSQAVAEVLQETGVVAHELPQLVGAGVADRDSGALLCREAGDAERVGTVGLGAHQIFFGEPAGAQTHGRYRRSGRDSGTGEGRLEHLDYALVARQPKVVVGYSDVDALLLTLRSRSGLVTFHGPMGSLSDRPYADAAGDGGGLARARALVVGQLARCVPPRMDHALIQERVLEDHVRPLGVPAWRGAMFGHVDRQLTPLPLGVMVEADADDGTIRMLERAVA